MTDATIAQLCAELTARIQQLSGPADVTDELRSLAGLIRMKQRVTNAGGRPRKPTRNKALAAKREKWRVAKQKRRNNS